MTNNSAKTLTSRVLSAALRSPDAPAVICEREVLSYRRLVEAANHAAQQLRRHGVRAEEPIAVLATRESEFVVAILGVMLSGCCYVPVDPALPAARLQQTLRSARIRILMGSAEDLASLKDGLACTRIVVVSRPQGPPAESTDEAVEAGLAYQLFTSGSTGTPKLVAIEHRSVCALLDGFNDYVGLEGHESVTAIAPLSFDVSVWEIFAALASGGALHVLPAGLARDPAKFASYLVKNGVGTAYIPPAILDAFVDELAHLGDTNSLRCVLVGVEPILQGTLQRLRDKCPDLRIINAYGPTEATVCSTLFPFIQASDAGARTPIGWQVPGWEVLVVDEALEPVAAGEVGEIIIGGAGLARGYVGVEEENAKFITRRCSRRFYRTGDLARVLPTGALEFIGRRDLQVKIRGFRVEPVEIENALMRHPGVSRSIVIVMGNVQAQRLYAFVEGTASIEELHRHLEKLLPEYLRPSRIVSMVRFPLTSHGKIDKAALSSQARARPLIQPLIEATTPFEKTLSEAWREVLDLEEVGITDNFFELGGDSMLALVLAKRLSTLMGVRAGVFLPHQTIAAAAIAFLGEGAHAPPPPSVLADYADQPAPLSFGQEGLWTFQKIHPDNSAFVLPVAIRVQGKMPLESILEVLVKLMRRQEIFSLEYVVKGRTLIQVPAAKPHPISVVTTANSGDPLHRELTRLFLDSAKEIVGLSGVPVRIHVVRAPGDATVLLFVFHHIAIDGASVASLISDLAGIIGGEPGAADSVTKGPRYFASIQRSRAGGANWMRMQEFWRRQLTPRPAALALPKRKEGGAHRAGFGACLTQTLPDAGVDALTRFARENGTTMFTAILTAIAMLVRREAAQEDFVVSVPFSTRHEAVDIDEAIGYFVNILPLRFRIPAGASFRECLSSTRDMLGDAQENAAFPFEAIVLALGLPPQESLSLARLVVAQDIPSGLPYKSAAVELHSVELRQDSAMYELAIFVSATMDRVTLRWEYDDAVFDAAAVRGLQTRLEELLMETAAAAHP